MLHSEMEIEAEALEVGLRFQARLRAIKALMRLSILS